MLMMSLHFVPLFGVPLSGPRLLGVALLGICLTVAACHADDATPSDPATFVGAAEEGQNTLNQFEQYGGGSRLSTISFWSRAPAALPR
jgi:hypothetical protein